MVDVIGRAADELFLPLTVGGGLRTVDDIRTMLRAGADKVSLNTSAVKTPELITEGSRLFGNQCIVLAEDVRRNYEMKEGVTPMSDETGEFWYEVVIYGGSHRTGLDAAREFDYVEGGVANDRVVDTINLYIAGLIDLKSALRELSKHQPNNQMCLLNQSLTDKYLEYDGTEEL